METLGFWMVLAGALLVSGGMVTGEKICDWMEKKLTIPWYVLRLASMIIGGILVAVGWQISCVGYHGCYIVHPLE